MKSISSDTCKAFRTLQKNEKPKNLSKKTKPCLLNIPDGSRNPFAFCCQKAKDWSGQQEYFSLKLRNHSVLRK